MPFTSIEFSNAVYFNVYFKPLTVPYLHYCFVLFYKNNNIFVESLLLTYKNVIRMTSIEIRINYNVNAQLRFIDIGVLIIVFSFNHLTLSPGFFY